MKAKKVIRHMMNGLASLGNLSGKLTVPRPIRVTFQSRNGRTFIRNDKEALREDWRAVGYDIEEATRRYRCENEDQFSKEITW